MTMRLSTMISLAFVLTSCTLSFQNIDTHGVATDVVDEDLQTDADVSPDISLPVSAI